MIKFNCSICGIDFFRHKAHATGKNVLCSRKCYGKLRSKLAPPVDKHCPQCGKYFQTGRRGMKHHSVKFCSEICHNLSKQTKKEHPCLKCGKMVWRRPAHLKNRVFCSRKCYDTSPREKRQKTYKQANNSLYRGKRVFLLETFGKCQKCGYNEHPSILEVHHKDENRRNNSIENLILLCPNCHKIEHKKSHKLIFKK